ncbi:ankyrin repeat-containing protein BDA1-like [Humulus lupulus]|uniref:ankyrin repeat-containing protein BDA1-like n=1 Tax=Humulus lupulus TaxID=3486 RepID=UPI002B4179DE|nr:ankyrin repeat-containing protein BDA1-like [Humulus lupulus]
METALSRSTHDRDDATVSMLFEASVEGSVVTLNSLFQEDPLIMTRISLTTSTKSPLHNSAALNHLDFTKQLLKLKPQLASELDSFKRSPLHLAAAEGHMEIVRALLHENKDVCFVKDKYGKIPLHYAAMRGRVDVIRLLIDAQSESVFEVLPSGETALHLCVQHNHLEALKLLVEAVGRHNADFLNAKDRETQNTVLHLAVMLNQVETVEYLVSTPGVEEDTLNRNGYKAADLLVLDDPSTDFNTIRIRHLMGIDSNHHPKSMCRISWVTELLTEYKRDWLKEMRGSIMVVATVIASTTFYTAFNPPGGVWQESTNTTDIDPNAPFNCDKRACIAGTAVLAYAWKDYFLTFIVYNSVAFLAALSVVLLIVGGFPLKSKIGVWFLTMVICVTLTFTALTFLHGIFLVTPNHVLGPVTYIYKTSFKVWIGLLVTIGVYHTIHFGFWVYKILRRGRSDTIILMRRQWPAPWFCSCGVRNP